MVAPIFSLLVSNEGLIVHFLKRNNAGRSFSRFYWSIIDQPDKPPLTKCLYIMSVSVKENIEEIEKNGTSSRRIQIFIIKLSILDNTKIYYKFYSNLGSKLT